MNDHDVVNDRAVQGKRLVHLEIGLHVALAELDILPLKPVVKLLRDREERRITIQEVPVGVDAHIVHQRNQRTEHAGDAAPVIRRIHVENAQSVDRARSPLNVGEHLPVDGSHIPFDSYPVHQTSLGTQR